jgi:hypothetical protein
MHDTASWLRLTCQDLGECCLTSAIAPYEADLVTGSHAEGGISKKDSSTSTQFDVGR